MFKFAGRITLLERTDKNMSVGHFENTQMTYKSFCLILLSNHICSLVFTKIQPGKQILCLAVESPER